MSNKKKGRRKKVNHIVCPDISMEQEDTVAGIPTADEVADEREREADYMRDLTRLADGGDSSSSEAEMRLRAELGGATARRCAPLPEAAALLRRLADALRAAHDVRFLEEYAALLERSSQRDARAAAEQLIRSAEAASGDDGGGVVLVVWLCAAAVWRAPRVFGALPALHRALRPLPAPELQRAAGALHAALDARGLLAAGDAARGAGGGRLAALLLRAALARLAGLQPDWRGGAPDAAEVRETLAPRWAALDARSQLAGLALAGRVLPGAERAEAEALLAALAPPPPPRILQDPDHPKLGAAVKTLQNLFLQR